MRLLVCGSRCWDDADKIEEVLTRVTDGAAEVVLIHGAARGADRLGEQVGRRRGWRIEAYPAEWERTGRRAGMDRNRWMLTDGRPDFVVAFLDERTKVSNGTRDMIRRATQAGIRGLVVRAR